MQNRCRDDLRYAEEIQVDVLEPGSEREHG
jgi:hypothetical protein